MSKSRRNASGSGDPGSGTLLKRSLLGTDAVYRVVGRNERGFEVEVVEAPGLSPGSRFTFTREDVLAMTPLAESEVAGVTRSAQGQAGQS
jgi:hypothetical protein